MQTAAWFLSFDQMLPAASSCQKQDAEADLSGIMGPHMTWKLWFPHSVECVVPSETGGS